MDKTAGARTTGVDRRPEPEDAPREKAPAAAADPAGPANRERHLTRPVVGSVYKALIPTRTDGSTVKLVVAANVAVLTPVTRKRAKSILDHSAQFGNVRWKRNRPTPVDLHFIHTVSGFNCLHRK